MIQPSNPTSGCICMKEIKSLSREDTSGPLLAAALFTVDNSLQQLRWPLRVRKKLSSHKKGGDLPASQQGKWTRRALY